MSEGAPKTTLKSLLAVAVATLKRLEMPDIYFIVGLFLLFLGLWSLFSWAVAAVVVGGLLAVLGVSPHVISMILEVRGA